MEIALLAGVGLLVLFNFFVLVMCMKSWKFFHVFMLFCVFAASIGFCVYAALLLKTHSAWTKVYKENSEKLDKAETDQQALLYGDLSQVEQARYSLANIDDAITREVVDRGRIWRGCVPTNFDGKAVTLQTAVAPPPPVDPAAPAPPPPAPNRIELNSLLFVFREEYRQDIPGGSDRWKVPNDYVGEFQATSVTPSTVTLAPTLPLDSAQQALLQNLGPGTTWVLYELLPLDNHEVFAGLDKEELKRWFPQDRMNLPDAEYADLIDKYRFYEQPIQTIKDTLNAEGRDGNAFDPPPSEVWLKIKFTKPVTGADSIEVDADEIAGSPLNTTNFDSLGRAQAPLLKQGGKTEFEPDDEEIFDQESAKKFLDAGTAVLVTQVYKRKLTDYELEFHEFFRLRKSLSDRIDAITIDIADVTGAKTNVETQNTRLDEEIVKLKEDVKNYQDQLAKVTQYHEKLAKDLTALKVRINETYGQNKALGTRKAVLQQALIDQIDMRTRQAVAEAK